MGHDHDCIHGGPHFYDAQATPFRLHQAIQRRSMTCVRNALERNKDHVNVVDESGYTPLLYACTSDEEGMVDLLLEHGADPNSFTPSLLSSCLHRAVQRERHDTVRSLLKAGALESKNTDGDLPSTIARRKKDIRMIKLLESYAIPNSSNKEV